MTRILIVEDDESIAEIEHDYLEMGGIHADIALSGSEGMRMITTGGYDLIVLDIMLPDMDGFQILKKIRGEVDVPILMVTAKQSDIDIVRGLNFGADDYIIKPFSPNELVARVKSHLARFNRIKDKYSTDGSTEINGLAIDPESRVVTLYGETVSLTAKEFDILHFLSTHPNQVFSRAHLFDRIWGVEAVGDISTVTVHIRKIREKIEGPDVKFIETVWGVGYKFLN
ncbi:MAG TPA: response regulator transcription factor [Candidatus Salinicoccus stercoripullorum]|uniref:Transcriptional regulatory protein SrrA n=1 Tax=Candidatus Salinicoccus stercoripullorum TaxID=2838756 RepID=A0A9D1QG19_9STAP|nr:response regulator transcription factor [Candidatus Salinicoccus stercoripullorum]